MKILITNDDGVHSEGIKALMESVPSGVEAYVCAPASERSAASHSISLGQKLRIEEVRGFRFPVYGIHGTPADCVKFALGGLKNFKPDLVMSGINHGSNTGISVFYSGTISAAREGFINKVPAVAVSLCGSTFRDFTACMEISRKIMEGYQQNLFPKDVMLTINVPPLPMEKILGVKITKQAASRFIEEFVPEKEHEGKKVFSLAGEIEVLDADGTSDEEAIAQGYISITPLKIDLTEYQAIPYFKNWLDNTSTAFPSEKDSKKNEAKRKS
jgi:5'-nucleotidase